MVKGDVSGKVMGAITIIYLNLVILRSEMALEGDAGVSWSPCTGHSASEYTNRILPIGACGFETGFAFFI